MHSSVRYTHTCLICVPRTAQLLIINITFWFLISKWRNFLIILFWVSFKLTEWGFATSFTFRRRATATTNPWVDQCIVCSVPKLDTFTLVAVTFEWLGRFWKTKFSMKADLHYKSFSLLTSSKYKTSSSLKSTQNVILFSDSPCITWITKWNLHKNLAHLTFKNKSPPKLKSVFPKLTQCSRLRNLDCGDCLLPSPIIVLGKGKRQSPQSKFWDWVPWVSFWKTLFNYILLLYSI